jgi:hypothetical protein
MELPKDTFKEKFDLGEYSNHSGKEAFLYGENWLEVVVDNNEVGIILIADTSELIKDASIELYPNAPSPIAIIGSDHWNVDIIIPINKAVLTNKFIKSFSLCIIHESDPSKSILNTIEKMDFPLKQEIIGEITDGEITLPENYLDKKYPEYLRALLAAGEVSNVTPYFLSDDFNPKFTSVVVVRHD